MFLYFEEITGVCFAVLLLLLMYFFYVRYPYDRLLEDEEPIAEDKSSAEAPP